MKWRLAVLGGDGVGPEVTEASLEVLRATAERFGHELTADLKEVGFAAYEQFGTPLPEDTLAACRSADAVLLGAVGDPRSEGVPVELRPEAALLALRKEMGCYANLRPVRLLPALASASPLRPEIVDGTDLVIVRELAGGLYYGEPRGPVEDGRAAVDTMKYHQNEVVRIAKMAFETARGRRKSVLSVDKANVLHSSRLWRRVVDEVAEEYPDVECDHMLVDRAAMELLLNPSTFDVMLTPNLFGDVLSDEAAAVVGSIGLLASASIGSGSGIFEPIHGSAPDIAGTGTANPLAIILSAALLLRHVYSLDEESAAIESAVEQVLEDGLRTRDLARNGEGTVGTAEVGAAVAAKIANMEASADA
ncbi:MAG: 3-isopropylmalate dehydrogenase [Gemmatimonadota bacterium]|uniref:3-isopropylmalate dehydrogenase n=1 Tax=marine metagenome TaxID=408172 RepID=A0A381QDZ0_9ZZZZ|nr:3-isopropylmalate dehydrogenase [Gemmatimonadota bacterium]HAW89683.1 3-isopropylmalate dehydrogenase [Gemmatimonadota bacterium]|tara:strand:+ start:2018 stop:3106 length:1089 start_codon:yes stop_codon:yes gene_type:complete